MSSVFFKKIKIYTLTFVIIFIVFHLSWEYLNGGVVRHHLLQDQNLPAFSNWWEILILPLFTLFSFSRLKNRLTGLSENKIPKKIIFAFLGMILFCIIQSITFLYGQINLTMYLTLGMLGVGLFLPIYKVEYIFGYLLGSSFMFGPVIPFIGILMMIIVSVTSNLLIKPLILKITGR